jgi:hypothetical protein
MALTPATCTRVAGAQFADNLDWTPVEQFDSSGHVAILDSELRLRNVGESNRYVDPGGGRE